MKVTNYTVKGLVRYTFFLIMIELADTFQILICFYKNAIFGVKQVKAWVPCLFG